MGIKLTEEQKEIIKAFKDTERLKINAYAGTGKTTTLRALAEVYSGRRFLVLTFNRSIAEELKSKMPPNCTVFTIHGLAYRFTPPQWKKKLVDRKVFVDELIDCFGIEESHRAIFYRDVFDAFCNSAYLVASKENIKRIILTNSELKRKFYTTFDLWKLKPEERRYKVDEAIGMLSGIIENITFAISQGRLPMIHGFYLKAFQQSLDSFKDFFRRFDAILVDEGHDLNGVQEYVLRHAPVPQKVIVGDRHQSIYSWRGAINTLAKLEDWEERTLTTSFRFESDEVVEYANEFLKNWKGDGNRIVSGKVKKTNGLKAYVTRTNAALVGVVNRLNEPIAFSRDLDEIFRSAREAERLLRFYYSGDQLSLFGVPGYVKRMASSAREESRSVEEFIEHFSTKGEIEYAHALWIAERYDVEMLYRKAKKLYTPRARTYLTTAHSAKGLEFDRVHFVSGFPDLMDELVSFVENEVCSLEQFTEEKAREVVEGIKGDREEYGEIIDEINLQYVALTRVIKKAEGPGHETIRTNFETELSPSALMERVRDRQRSEGRYRMLWAEVSAGDDGIDWERLEGEF